jgi:spore coat protein U-like protein
MESNASGKPVTVTVFGRIPAGQDVAAGIYSDTIIVTIQF